MSPTRDVIGGSDTDVLADALARVVAGHAPRAAFDTLLGDMPGSAGFVERALRGAVARQDWDAVAVLRPVCTAHSFTAAAAPSARRPTTTRPHHREEQP